MNWFFLFRRWRIAVVLFGALMVLAGYLMLQLSRVAKSEAQEISIEKLLAEGPGDNHHVRVSGVRACDFLDYVYKGEEDDWDQIWLPAVPLDGPYMAGLEALPEGTPFEDIERPDDVGLILSFKKVKNSAELEALTQLSTFQGVIINEVSSLSRDTKELLREGYPEVDLDRCWILEYGKSPPSTVASIAFMAFGLIVSLGGGWFLYFRKKRAPKTVDPAERAD